MKNKILIVFLALFAFLLIGCKETELSEFNLMGNWVDGGNSVYQITTNTAEKLAFSYDKGNYENAYMAKKEISEDLSGMKKLVVTMKGTGSINLQLHSGKGVKEVFLNVTSNEFSYEWNLSNDGDFLKELSEVRIIGAPGKKEKTGSVEISKLMLYNTSADNYIIQTGYNNIPDNVNEYNGTDETFNFNAKWERFVPTEEVYDITVDGTVTKVTVEKESGAEWACIQSLVKGDFSKFNYVVAKVKGTAGQTWILKAANGYETQVILTGEDQYVAVDISGMTAAEKNSITAIFIFGYAGLASGSGYFDIIEAYMVEEYETGIIKNVYNGEDETFSLVNWYDGGQGIYDITNDDETVFDYDKDAEGTAYAFAETHIEGDISNFGKIVIEITGESGKKVLFKIEGSGQNVEKEIEFTGSRQTVDMPISSMSVAALKTVKKVILFAAPGENTAEGSFTLHSLTFMADVVDVNSGWVDNGDAVYTFTENADGSVTVNYDKEAGKEWATMKQVFGAEFERFNTVTIVVRGTAGKSILLKPNDSGVFEKSHTFEEGKDFTYTVTAESIVSYFIFAEGGTAPASGSFTIVSMTLSYVRPAGPKAEVSILSGWADNGNEVYTTELNNEGHLVVTYDKKTFEYPALINNFSGDLAGYNTITMVLRGTAGKKVILKPNDNGSLEKWVTFEEDKDVIFVVSTDAITKMVIMAEGGDTEVTGSFTIVSAVLSVSADVNSDWVDGGDGVYTPTVNADGSVTVNYDKKTFSYAALRQNFTGDLAGYNKITIVLQGTAGKSIIVKPNDSGALEQTITFEDGKDVLFTASAAEISSMIIMAEGGTEGVTGSFVIKKAYLSVVEEE
ncbi:MAG: hypothetical protein GX661_02250 [Acholeplasmataceae bacterium]|nr:hypothetical protein [Acholeplasmataceae bacterium]